jgi:hypothetical protein
MEGFAVNIERLEQTSFACPSQWDAWDENGTYYYIRYRWGDYVFIEQVGDELDGVMDQEDMLRLTGMSL